MPRFTVILDWRDHDVSDSDEMQVCAKTAAGATSRARAIWSATNGDAYPDCHLEKVWILTPRMKREFA